MIIVNCAQGSEEWHAARVGAITASMFKTARERLKSGKNAGAYKAAAKDYAFRVACERIGGQPLDEGFSTWAMRRGHELEPEARAAHEMTAGIDVEPTGIVLTDDRKFGGSADGLIGDDGGSEYKCLVAPDRIRGILIDRDIDEFQDQVQGCLWLTGRAWWHFVLYCPALAPVGRDLIIHQVERDDDYIESLESDLIAFDRLVGEYEEQIRSADTWLGRPIDDTAIPVAAPSAVGIF
ncbi:MAG TPA: YqaJ viral recombinase family protein [Gammaproteobacteria bacterium]|nr:YqaJ viral recombinase family protein [Gammaproteobacteria bacterium]